MKDKITLNLAGFRELRTSPAVQADLQRRAEAVAAALGDGFEVSNPGTRTRARRTVGPTTPEAFAKVRKTPAALVRALNAGR